jgi:uncharacterized RDD family membrane protein YckC
MDNEASLPAQPVPAVAAEISPAGFWVRGGAVLIDGIILAFSALLHMQVVSVLVGLTYKTIFVSQGGQTPGKMAAGIKVITVTGEPVSIGRALGRAASEYLSVLLLGLGYVAAAFGEKRALHDYIAGTRVVYLDGVGQGRKAAFACLGVLMFLLPFGAVAFASMGFLGSGRYGELLKKSGEGATKGNLGALRSGISIYYGDAEGQYPASLDALVPKYIPEIPKTKLGQHMESSIVTSYGAEVCGPATKYGAEIDATKLKDTGGWGYVSDPKASCWGQIFVDCSHKDSKDVGWATY